MTGEIEQNNTIKTDKITPVNHDIRRLNSPENEQCEQNGFFNIKQVWTQKCAVQKASVDVNISY